MNLLSSSAALLGEMRRRGPLVHCLTNHVVTNFTANVLLAAVLVTGPVDLVAVPGGAAPVRVANGVPLLTRVTGVGCAQGALCAALCAAADGDARLAAVAAALLVGIAGERAARVSERPGSFAVAFLDALDGIDAAAIEADGRVSG